MEIGCWRVDEFELGLEAVIGISGIKNGITKVEDNGFAYRCGRTRRTGEGHRWRRMGSLKAVGVESLC